MLEYGLPVLYALFVWWFSTGVIIYLDGLPVRTFRWSMLGATALLALSLYGLAWTSTDSTVSGAYKAFTFGLLAWGWQEISFYMGFVTGPRTQSCPEGCSGWRHFVHAIQTSLYHELGIIAGALAIVALTWEGPNQVGTWTFMVLWWMHQSAKLNVFLGVRNLNEEFLPAHLGFLRSFLTKKPMNLLFPFSVTISTVFTVVLVQRALAPGTSEFDVAAYTFLATLMTLAILEHWFLVLPLPSAALWSWSLHSRAATRPFEVEVVAGFLGAGKTTFLRRTLREADPSVRTMVLVNDFGALGIDGSLLSGRGADVVELPNGCICCSLRKDLARQIQDTVARFAPQRLLIEPSGVANVAELLTVLDQPALRPLVRSLRVLTVIDAASFLADCARMREHFEAQASLASMLIVNKADLASPAELQMVEDTLRALNPTALIVPATYGVVDAAALAGVPARRPTMLAADAQGLPDAEHDTHVAHAAGHHGDHALGLESWSARLGGACDTEGLRGLLEAIAGGAFGEIERIKGIARSGAGWIHFDVAGGRSSMAAFAAGASEEPRVVAIGRRVDEAGLRAAFEACTASTSARPEPLRAAIAEVA